MCTTASVHGGSIAAEGRIAKNLPASVRMPRRVLQPRTRVERDTSGGSGSRGLRHCLPRAYCVHVALGATKGLLRALNFT